MKLPSVFLFLSLLLLVGPTLWGDYSEAAPESVEPVTERISLPGSEAERLASLEGLRESMESLRQQLERERRRLDEMVSRSERDEQERQIDELRERFFEAEGNFLFLATGVDPREIGRVVDSEFDLRTELEEILRPLVESLLSMTEDARRLDQIRSEIELYTARKGVAERALENLGRYGEAGLTPEMAASIEALREDFERRRADANNRLRALQFQLSEIERQRKPFLQASREAIGDFFRNRGRNLILSISAFVLVFLGVNLLHKRVNHVVRRLADRGANLPFRLIDVAFYIGSVLAALLAAILVLYLSGDWVLLALVILILVATLLAARAGLPLFIEQLRFMLNLGEVRDGERIVFEGVPYRVESLGFQTILLNPALTGGAVRLSMRHLIGHRSRPMHPDEPWFPCAVGDWVAVGDEVYGEVIRQTPELVELRELGRSLRVLPTARFLSEGPLNRSHGFQLVIRFGIDYRYQDKVTVAVREQLEGDLQKGLQGLYGEGSSAPFTLWVEFAEAGASALQFDLVLHAQGSLAPDFERLPRLLQQLAVESCNRHGWEIPFTQVTIHRSSEDRGSSRAGETGGEES